LFLPSAPRKYSIFGLKVTGAIEISRPPLTYLSRKRGEGRSRRRRSRKSASVLRRIKYSFAIESDELNFALDCRVARHDCDLTLVRGWPIRHVEEWSDGGRYGNHLRARERRAWLRSTGEGAECADASMVRSFARRSTMQTDDDVTRIVITSATPAPFVGVTFGGCTISAGRRACGAAHLLREEYRLNRRIKRYPKPVVALIDGIVMGGGAGSRSMRPIASPAATSCSRCRKWESFLSGCRRELFSPAFAGAERHLSRPDRRSIGLGDVMASGLATHHVPSERHAASPSAVANSGRSRLRSKFRRRSAAAGRFAQTPGSTIVLPRRA